MRVHFLFPQPRVEVAESLSPRSPGLKARHVVRAHRANTMRRGLSPYRPRPARRTVRYLQPKTCRERTPRSGYWLPPIFLLLDQPSEISVGNSELLLRCDRH